MSDDKTKYDQPIAGHDYDGIQEFDNPLPMWWLWTFYGTIVFAAIYYFYYEIGSGPSLKDELKADIAQVETLKTASAPNPGNLDINAIAADPAKVAAGGVVFKEKCAACHGQLGEGLIGPNLTDNAWIHGAGTPEDILKVVQTGVLEKGMPPWKDTLKPEEQMSVAAFVKTLHGTNPPNPKAAEGTQY